MLKYIIDWERIYNYQVRLALLLRVLIVIIPPNSSYYKFILRPAANNTEQLNFLSTIGLNEHDWVWLGVKDPVVYSELSAAHNAVQVVHAARQSRIRAQLIFQD